MLGIGLIGTGGRSEAYVHSLPNAREGVYIAALVDKDEVKLKDYAGKYFCKENIPRLYTDYKEMLEDADVDAVVVCTPDATHKDIGIAVLKKEKNLLLEKPFATTLADCMELYDESLRHDRVFRLGFLLRYNDMYMKIKRLVSSGVLGRIITVQARETLSHVHAGSFFRRWNRFKSVSGGFLNTKCSHDMDILTWIIGAEPLYVSAFGGRSFFNSRVGAAERCRDCSLKEGCTYNFDAFKKRYGDFNAYEDLCVFNVEKDIVDHEVVNIEYDNGATVNYTVSMLSAEAGRSMLIFGTEATLQMNVNSEDPAKTYIEVKYINPKKVEVYHFYSNHDIHGRLLAENFIDSIQTDLYSGKSDARAGLLSSGLAMAADLSMEEKRVIDMKRVLNYK